MSLPYLVRGYPKNSSSDAGVRNTYLYRGPTSALKAFALTYAVNNMYVDGMPVETVDLEPLENELISDMTVVTFLPRGQATIPTGSGAETGNLPPPNINPDAPLPSSTSVPVTIGEVKRGAAGVADEYPFYEIDSTQVEKPLLQHPAFSELTAAQRQGCRAWDDETDTDAKASFQYWKRDKDGNTVGSVQSLDSDQTKYATLRLFGVEAFPDFAPLARKTSKYRGNTTPDVDDCGQKIDGDPFDGVPADYEWLALRDSATKQGEGSDWIRVQEWQAARKILLDKDELFLD